MIIKSASRFLISSNVEISESGKDSFILIFLFSFLVMRWRFCGFINSYFKNDFENDNLFDKNLMYTIRTWMYYKQNKCVVYAISPFAYFSNYKIIQKESDAVAKPINEYRFTASIELQHELSNKLFIVDRTAIEYRVFEGSIENTTRLRNRLAFRYDFNSKYNLAIGDEILLNTTGTDAQHIFDHNRIFTNFSYKPNSTVKFDIGYIYISRLTKTNVDLIEESNIFLNFTYTLHKKKV